MATQFQNAFSDNALKNLIILLVLARPMSQAERDTSVMLAGALFALPFILFSMFGGWLADRFSKQQVMERVKTAEIGIMFFAALAFLLHSLPLQLLAILCMGTHSALFGPSKYGILPEVLPFEKLSWGNGVLELLTFLGIILGTLAGGLFASWFKETPAVSGLVLAAIAIGGWMLSRSIPKVPPANPQCSFRVNPITDLWRQLMRMRGDRDLWRANLGNTGFFFIAALVQMNLVLFAHDVLKLSETGNASLNAALAIGIGVGSVLAGYASRGKIEYRLVPAGALVMFLSTIPMGLAAITTPAFSTALVALGLGAGLFIVPITAVLQSRPAPENKGAVQGAASVLSFVGILASTGVQRLLRLVLSSGEIFWVCGAVALLVGTYVAYSRRAEFTA
ncbi:MAG: acyl-[acyl-carrier-protein]-phospholipid O-acyltransferase / LCFA-[acyl-carrier-protein] ligase [Verrucomicrobia bacterium]|nr:MAG: acyl-[acyl-carrier-protein]-phospholipid O-acyltransferase / LCFA-[acyl-carrier-protein] ligase [Verrucomicrobiota bacterium]